VMVELNPGFSEEPRAAADGDEATAPAQAIAGGESAGAPPHGTNGTAQAGSPVAQGFSPAGGGSVPQRGGPAEPAGPPLGDQAEGVQRAGRILGAATGARWPMYLRNVKQILRQTDGGFDERRYGFGGLMDLLKGCQREGFVRVERDRRGGLRVFQGSALQRVSAPLSDSIGNVAEPVETQPGESFEMHEPAETEQPGSEPIPIDTTAELLGRAKPRKPRARALRPAPAAAPKKAAAKKPAPRKSARSRNASSPQANHDNSQ